jgi:hypothetical protein
MTSRLFLRLRISMPHLQPPNVDVKKKHIRKEAHENRSTKEYAHNMAEWSKMAQIYNENMQKFMDMRSDMHIYLLFLLILLVYYLIMCIVCYLIIECGCTHWIDCQCSTSSSSASPDASDMCFNFHCLQIELMEM